MTSAHRLHRDLPGPRQLKQAFVPGMLRLLSPDSHHVPAEGVCLMALTEHVTVGRGDSQRSGWHLADPKVGSQDCARVRDVSTRIFVVGIEQPIGQWLP
jgi:hypothetical protein